MDLLKDFNDICDDMHVMCRESSSSKSSEQMISSGAIVSIANQIQYNYVIKTNSNICQVSIIKHYIVGSYVGMVFTCTSSKKRPKISIKCVDGKINFIMSVNTGVGDLLKLTIDTEDALRLFLSNLHRYFSSSDSEWRWYYYNLSGEKLFYAAH